jgi:WD40 repeat protein
VTSDRQSKPWEKAGWDIGTQPRKGIVIGVRSDFEGGGLFVMEAATGKVVRRLDGKAPKHYWREQFRLSEDGELLALGEMNFEDQSSAVRLWETTTGKELHPVPHKPVGGVRTIALSSDRQTLAMSYLESHSIELYDLKTRKWLRRIEQAREPHAEDNNLLGGQTRMIAVTALAFSPDGQRIAAGNNDGGIDLWDLPPGKDRGDLKRRTFGDKSHPLKDLRVRGIGLIAFSRNGKMLFALDGLDGLHHASDGRRLRSWDIASGKERVLPCKDRTVHAFAVSLDGTTLAILVPEPKMKARLEVWRLRK